MPIYFWNDPEGERYREAYFSVYPNVWRHGDWAEITSRGGMIIYGRSDTVLKPGGVRIGTAEIYRQVEQFAEVLECAAVGQQWNNDQRVVLFVRMQAGKKLDDELAAKIRARIKKNVSPFHVPAKIIEVPDIPRTRSGKIVELAIQHVIHGRPVKNVEALANPEALRRFENIAALKEE
jgi:acetoacetyl-CoA synthetase